jgi:hypothetical protein
MYQRTVKIALIVGFYYCGLTFNVLAQFRVEKNQTESLLLNADTILRGEVLKTTSAWESDRNIYTTVQINVDEWYMGSKTPQIYTFKQRGGVVGRIAQVGSHLADFQKGENIVLFLKQGNVWAGERGKFAIEDGIVQEASLRVRDFDSMMKQMVAAPSLKWQEIQRQFEAKQISAGDLHKTAAVAISGFTPTSASGGTGSMITISGSGFGATQGAGKVEFTKQANGSDVTISWVQGEIVTWSDTVIRVLMPATTSSGKIRVTDNTATSATSSTSITLTYGLSSRKWASASPSVTYLINGGSISGLQNSDVTNARLAVENAIDTWNNMFTANNIQFAFVKGGSSSSTAISYNGSNEVVFNGASIPGGSAAGGVLAVNWNWFDTTSGIIEESDIDFDNADDWDDTGMPSGIEQDIWTVALHELGHTANIYDYYNQSLDNAKVMYGFSTSGTLKRTLNVSETNALKALYGYTGQTTSLAGGDGLDLAAGDNVYYAFGTSDAPNLDVGTSGDNFTIEAWINPSAYPSSGNVGIIAAKSKMTSDRSYEFVLNSAGKLEFRLSANGTSVTTLTSTATIALNTWTHVMAVFDNVSNNAMLIAINGAKDVNQFHIFTSDTFNSSCNFVVGGAHNGTSVVGEFAGKIDELRVLSGTKVFFEGGDVFSSYALPASFHTNANTKALWKFGDADGSAIMLSKTQGTAVTYYDRSGSLQNLSQVSAPLGVELTSFNYQINAQKLILKWVTANESNNAGFDIEHRINATEEFERIGFIKGKGTSTASSNYEFSLDELQPGLHTFRLKQKDFDGTVTYSDPLKVLIEGKDVFAFSDVYPNPFNPNTNFYISAPLTQKVEVEVFDLLGRKITQLFDGQLISNEIVKIGFDATDLPAGVYFIRATGESFVATQKATLIK